MIFIGMIEILNKIVLHPYTLAVYGVLLWQVEQWWRSKADWRTFLKDSQRNIGRSLVWVGLVVVFDDEIIGKYNHWAASDIPNPAPIYFYTLAGFFIDIIRTKIIDKTK
jgi:hypothetical protein